jgi:Lon protease-like protein
LGADLEELSGCTLYDENSIVSLPLLVQQQGTMALPGQILPLSLFHSATIGLLRETIAKDRTFGLVSAIEGNKHHRHDQTKHRLVGTVGVTAETYEHRENEDANRGYGLKARCRQRFKVIEVTEHFDS